MNRSLISFFVSLNSLGGMLILPFSGDYLFFLLSIVIACISLLTYKESNRAKKFGLLVIINIITALLLNFIPHASSGRIPGFGAFVGISIFFVSGIILLKMFWLDFSEGKRGED